MINVKGGCSTEHLSILVERVLRKANKILEEVTSAVEKSRRGSTIAFNRALEAQVRGETKKLIVHVQEVCKVRSVQKALLTIKLVLENLIVRLESADSPEDIKLVVTPSIRMVENSRIAVLPEVPGLAVKLGELVELLVALQRNLGVEDEVGGEEGLLMEMGSKRPLIEANSIACLKTAEYTPYIPVVQGG